MDFKEKIKESMILLHEACKMNEHWSECKNCPFINYCDAIEESEGVTPDDDKFLVNVV